jgi:hypothetical protein
MYILNRTFTYILNNINLIYDFFFFKKKKKGISQSFTIILQENFL